MNFSSLFSVYCYALHFSVWTIDLAFILHHYQVPFHFYTITLGVDKGYSSEVRKTAMTMIEVFVCID